MAGWGIGIESRFYLLERGEASRAGTGNRERGMAEKPRAECMDHEAISGGDRWAPGADHSPFPVPCSRFSPLQADVLDHLEPIPRQADLPARRAEHAQLAQAQVGQDLAAGAVAAPFGEGAAAAARHRRFILR